MGPHGAGCGAQDNGAVAVRRGADSDFADLMWQSYWGQALHTVSAQKKSLGKETSYGCGFDL